MSGPEGITSCKGKPEQNPDYNDQFVEIFIRNLNSNKDSAIVAVLPRIEKDPCNPKYIDPLINAIQRFRHSNFSLTIKIFLLLLKMQERGVKFTKRQLDSLSKFFPWLARTTVIDGQQLIISGRNLPLFNNLVLTNGSVILSQRGFEIFKGDTVTINSIKIEAGNGNILLGIGQGFDNSIYIDPARKDLLASGNFSFEFMEGNPILKIRKKQRLRVNIDTSPIGLSYLKINGDNTPTFTFKSGEYSEVTISNGSAVPISLREQQGIINVTSLPQKKLPGRLSAIPMNIGVVGKTKNPVLVAPDNEHMPRKCTLNYKPSGQFSHNCEGSPVKKADYFRNAFPNITLTGNPSAPDLLKLVHGLNSIPHKIKKTVNTIEFVDNIRDVCEKDVAACIRTQTKQKITVLRESADKKIISEKVINKKTFLDSQTVYLRYRFRLFSFYHEVGHALGIALDIQNPQFKRDYLQVAGNIHGKVARLIDGEAAWIDKSNRLPHQPAHGCVRAYSCTSWEEDHADLYGKSMTSPNFFTKYRDPRFMKKLKVLHGFGFFTAGQFDKILHPKPLSPMEELLFDTGLTGLFDSELY